MREKHLGIWLEVTWSQYWDNVLDTAHAYLALGVAPGDRVAVHSENRSEWLYADLAAMAVRAITVGLYPTNPVSETAHVLRDSGARLLVAEDQEQVDKALSVRERLPALERIIYLEPRGVRGYGDPLLVSWEDFLAMGREHRRAHPGEVETRMAAAQSTDVVAIFYTSGTTGPPKGAMLTVDNVEFAVRTVVEEGGWFWPPLSEDDVLLSYLPLAHIAERIAGVWHNLAAGSPIHFAESVDTVEQSVREVQPSVFLGVPRIWEKLHTTIHVRAANASPLKRANVRLWLALSDRLAERVLRREGHETLGTRLVRALGWAFFYRPLRDRVGLRKCRFALSGSAGVPKEIVRFFWGIGVPIYQVYGMTEASAVCTATRPGRVRLGLVGEPLEGAEVRLAEGTHEILVRHPGVFAGYWRKEAATAAAVDAGGWLHTGDVGRWVGSHLDVVDRLRDVITTDNGVQVSPLEIECALKSSPYVKDAIVVGEGRPYLTALIGIDFDAVGEFAQRRRLPYTTYRDLTERPEVIGLVSSVVAAVNRQQDSPFRLAAFRLLPKILDHEDGELTATQKVKRSAVAAAFASLIDEMYHPSPAPVHQL
jgi:long-chain acyl-CoA synthetase